MNWAMLTLQTVQYTFKQHTKQQKSVLKISLTQCKQEKILQKTSCSLNPDAEVQLQQAPNETRGFEPIHLLAQWW